MQTHFGIRGWSRLVAVVASFAMVTGLALAAAAADAQKSAAATTPPAKSSAGVPAKIDINRADKTQLAKLPGIGDVYSQKIIDGRPYKSKDELESRKILPKGVYEKIAPLIIAHQK